MKFRVWLWVAVALAAVGVWLLAAGTAILFAWTMDGMDPGTQSSSATWTIPYVIGLAAFVPVLVVFAIVYVRWCARMIRRLFSHTEPITVDSGW